MEGQTLTGETARQYLGAWMRHGSRGVSASALRADALSGSRRGVARLALAASACRGKAPRALPAGRCRLRGRRGRSRATGRAAVASGGLSGSPGRPRPSLEGRG